MSGRWPGSADAFDDRRRVECVSWPDLNQFSLDHCFDHTNRRGGVVDLIDEITEFAALAVIIEGSQNAIDVIERNILCNADRSSAASICSRIQGSLGKCQCRPRRARLARNGVRGIDISSHGGSSSQDAIWSGRRDRGAIRLRRPP